MNLWRNEPSNSFVLVDSGVAQGSVLDLALFVLYRNDLPQQTYSTLRLFASDTTHQRPVSKTEDQGVLQNDLNDLAAWKGRWNMRFHPNKREILSITRALKSPDCRKNLFGERQGLQGIRQTGTDQDLSGIRWSWSTSKSRSSQMQRDGLSRDIAGHLEWTTCWRY